MFKIDLLDFVSHQIIKLQLSESGFSFHLHVKKEEEDRKPICWGPLIELVSDQDGLKKNPTSEML
jgi:hypothetical protein